MNPLRLQSFRGNTARVRALLAEGADVHEVDENGNTALMWACSYSHAPVVRLLIEAGADLESQLRWPHRSRDGVCGARQCVL